MSTDQDLASSQPKPNAYEEKLARREKRIRQRMQRRYGDKGFLLNHRPNYLAFRTAKIIGHVVSVCLAIAFVYDLFLHAITSLSISDLQEIETYPIQQRGIVLGLFILACLVYSSIEYLKSISIQTVFKAYYQPKENRSRFKWGSILLTLCLLSLSIFASFRGGKLLPTLFNQGVDEESFLTASAHISIYEQQIQELTMQREQLTNGDLGYRYGWKQTGAQNFSLNESGQRKLEELDSQLKLLREKLIQLNESAQAHQRKFSNQHAQKVNKNGWYLAVISLLMEVLIVISGAWLVWYGVNVEASIRAQMRKDAFSAQMDLHKLSGDIQDEVIQMEMERPAQLGIAQVARLEPPIAKAQIIKEIVREAYFRLAENGVRPTWRNVLSALPEEEGQQINEYKVRRILTELRKAPNN